MTELAVHTTRLDRVVAGGQQRQLGLAGGVLGGSQLGDPRFVIGTLAARCGIGERPQGRRQIADHRQGIRMASSLRLGVDHVGDGGFAEAPEAEPEVEWCPEHDDHVGTLLEQPARP